MFVHHVFDECGAQTEDTNRPEGAQTMEPGAERSGAAAERRPRWTGPHTIQAPTGAQQEPTRRVSRSMFASCKVFIETIVLVRKRALASCCGAPFGAWELFLRLPRATRCRRSRRHRSALVCSKLASKCPYTQPPHVMADWAVVEVVRRFWLLP